MIRTYWMLAIALVLLAVATEIRSPGLGVLAIGTGFVWWDSAGDS